MHKVTNFVYFCFCFYSEMTKDIYTERKYPWGNQEKSICAKYLGVDDMIANSSFSSSNEIIICHLNVVSLVKNINKVEDFLNEFTRKPDVICISETKLKNENLQYITLYGYNFFCYNSVTKAGGAGIYVINSIHCVEVCDLRMNLTGCEDVWVQATLGDKSTLVIGSVYRHPHPNFLEFLKAFNKNFLKLKAKKRFVILEDLNIDYGRYLSNPRVKGFADQITSLGCEQLTDFPTRVCSTRQSILDHVYINGNTMNAVTTSAVITHPLSDHFPIVVQLEMQNQQKRWISTFNQKYQTT